MTADAKLAPKDRAYVIGLLGVAYASAKAEGMHALAEWFLRRIADLSAKC
jgi:hypothetical protein